MRRNHRRCRRFLCVLMISPLLFSGCDFLTIFQNQKKLVKQRISRFTALVAKGDWKSVQKMMTNKFIYEAVNGGKFRDQKNKAYGKIMFIKSMRGVPSHRNFYTTVESVIKLKESGDVIAIVKARLRIHIGIDKFDNVTWRMKQKWHKVNDAWMLSEVKDLTEKMGTHGRVYKTHPRSKNSRAGAASKTRRRPGIAGEVDSFADYATGYTPLKIREESRTRLGKIIRERQKRMQRNQ